MTVLMTDGAPTVFGGYAVPARSPSSPILTLGGRREVWQSMVPILDFIRRHGGAAVPVEVHALDHTGRHVVCDQSSARIRMWADRHGLAFAATAILPTSIAAWAVGAVARGDLCKASVYGSWRHSRQPRADGCLVVDRVDAIEHITLVGPFDAAFDHTHVGVSGVAGRGLDWSDETHRAWEASRQSPASFVPKIAPPAPIPAPRRSPRASVRRSPFIAALPPGTAEALGALAAEMALLTGRPRFARRGN